MKHFTATEAKNRFGELMEESGKEAVAIEKNGKSYRVVLAAEEYERLVNLTPVRSVVRDLHKRSMERRREVYEELAK